LSEAYEQFGCGTDELYTIAVSGYGNDTDADCIAYWATHDLSFRGISKDGGSGAIVSTYGIGAYPTYILIAPNHDIVEQDMWPISNAQTFVGFFESNGLSPSTCESLAADFEANEVEACEGDEINFTDLSEGVPITWDWTFEGGTPATSTEENPTVTYDIAGTYDVELMVHDGVATTTTSIVDYITVLEYPNTTLDPFDLACVNWPAFLLTGGLPEDGVYSGDYVTDGMFDPAAAGIGDHTIFYSYTNEGGCEAIAEQILTVDACAGISENLEKSIKIYPNPTTEIVNLISDSQIVRIHLYNYVGQIVLEKNVNGNSCQLNISEFKSGIYSIRLETKDGIVVKQILKK
jgi:PKD repeat protein